MKLDSVSKEQWEECLELHTSRADRFAKTFYSKCNLLNGWEQVSGLWEGDDLMAAVLTTIGKVKPVCANLQLLHTFNKYRRKGYGKILCQHSLSYAVDHGAQYFRVSAEPDAVAFYKAIGFRFWGEQKSRCQLSIFKIRTKAIRSGIYDSSDEYILSKILPSKRKGSIIVLFEEPR